MLEAFFLGGRKMNKKNIFSEYHPLVNFSYFSFVILFSCFIGHPVLLFISVIASFLYSVKLNGSKAVKFNLMFLLPLLVFSAVINPLFNHEGATILTYFKSGNPLTLESMVYGVSQAFIIVSVIMWFSCFNSVITSDKFIYLFGRIIPSMSLMLSMALRFIPDIKKRFSEIRNAQAGLLINEKKGIINKIKNLSKTISILTTWSLENAVDTADNMKNRGYGIKGRTSFLIYNFEKRDLISLLLIFAFGIYTLFGIITKEISYSYFPYLDVVSGNISVISFYFVYALMCFYPLIIEIREDIRWKLLKLTT